jgi:hypothetical protein
MKLSKKSQGGSFTRQKRFKKNLKILERENERCIPQKKLKILTTSLWRKKEPFLKMEEGPSIFLEVKILL